MIKRCALLMLGFLSYGIFLSAAAGNQTIGVDSPPHRFPQSMGSGVLNGNPQAPQQRQATGREEIAYMDERDIDIHERADRKGDWNYRQNWRYDRQAFYRGETQGDAYNREHPEASGGPGFDKDTEFLEMRRYYLENGGQGGRQVEQQRAYQPQ